MTKRDELIALDPAGLEAAVRECARITAPEISDAEYEQIKADNSPRYQNTREEMARTIRAYLNALQPANASIPTCCVTGAIPGDGGACGDCDPCLLGEASVPAAVRRLISEKNSLLHRMGELESALEYVRDARWNENADLDDICDRAEKALTTAPPAPSVAAHRPLAWLHEDDLPDGYPYSEMHKYSEVRCGVRMFPVYAPPHSALITAPQDDVSAYAERLAIALWEKHYKDSATDWKPLTGDLMGLLTQIDNMTAALRGNQSDGGAKAGSSPILASKEDQRAGAHGMTPVGIIADAAGCTDVGPSDTTPSRPEVSVEEVALTLMNARRSQYGLDELTSERMKAIGLWPLKAETMNAARALIAKYHMEGRE